MSPITEEERPVDVIEYVAKRYRCPHCRKSYAHRATATNHVARCFVNPTARTCKTCRLFEFYPPEPEVGIMSPGYQCHGGVDLHVDRCSRCGGVLYPDGTGECSCDPWDTGKPIVGLRVRCDVWEREA